MLLCHCFVSYSLYGIETIRNNNKHVALHKLTVSYISLHQNKSMNLFIISKMFHMKLINIFPQELTAEVVTSSV